MEPQERTGLGAWPPIIIVILLATTSAFLSRIPLESVRPVPTGQGVSTSQIQDYDARLWQDPFGIVPKNSTHSTCFTISGHRVCEESAVDDTVKGMGELKELIKAKQDPVHIVYALVPGGNWVGADEYRRRTRYALLAGANQSGYYPDDPEHLGYVEDKITYAHDFKTDGAGTAIEGGDDDKNTSEKTDLNTGTNWEIRLPFEWLSLSDQTNRDGDDKASSVLILWVDEESLGQTVLVKEENWLSNSDQQATFLATRAYPLSRLASLVSEIAVGEEDSKSHTHTIIGPFSSTFLVAATSDPGREKARDILKDKRVRWFSPTATLPDDNLVVQLRVDEGQGSKKLSTFLPDFYRLIATDEKLAEALVEELKLRGVSEKADTAIALVGLWDTAYSRELRKLIANKIEEEIGPSDDKILLTSYLRGVDGRLPGVDDRENNAGNSKDGASKQIERPEGDGQVDYLRRLALNLKRRSDQDDLTIRAIGVFGDDYYDKLLALQALRPSFPGAVFFTTDLEASMLHPADNKYTRNLIVASAFDLTLKTKLQGDIPPFRYSYQTAQFLAAQMALNGHELPHLKDGEKESGDDALPPRGHEVSRRALLFEIGYSEPVLLASICVEGNSKVQIPGTNEDQCQPKGMQPLLDPHPSLPDPPKDISIYLLPATVLVVMLAALSMGRVRSNHLKTWIAMLLISLALSVSWHFLQNFQPDAREPYRLAHWLQGVSVWPGEFLRFLALVTAVLLTRRGLRLLRKARDEVDRDFFDGCAMQQQQTASDLERGSQRGRRSVFQSITRCFRQSFKTYPALDVKPLWCIYAGGGRHWRTINQETVSAPNIDNVTGQDIRSTRPVNICLPLWPRVALFLVIALLISSLLQLLMGEVPNTPTRGVIENRLDKFLLIGAVLSFLVLLSLAVIESIRAIWFARGLATQDDWPDTVLKRFLPEQEIKPSTPGKDVELPTPQKAVEHWIDVEVISRITDPVQRIIFYPFAVIAILIVARSPLFDAWNMPGFLLLLFSLYIAMLVTVAVLIRITAEDLRKRASFTITQVLLHAKTQETQESAKQLEALLDYLKNLRRGAFAHLSQQPLVHALLTLIGSYSGIALLEYLRLSGI